jgi:hypothetical protein
LWKEGKAMINIILVLISIVFFSSTAWADWSVENYKKLKEDEIMRAYINGVGVGLTLGNVIMGAETGKTLFCPPETPALGKANNRE